jgi:hypothetical protein
VCGKRPPFPNLCRNLFLRGGFLSSPNQRRSMAQGAQPCDWVLGLATRPYRPLSGEAKHATGARPSKCIIILSRHSSPQKNLAIDTKSVLLRRELSSAVSLRPFRKNMSNECGRFRANGYACCKSQPFQNLSRNLFLRGGFLPHPNQRRSMAQRDNRHFLGKTCTTPQPALRAVVRCSQVPRWGQTK